MQKMYTPARIGVIFVVLAVMLSAYVSALFIIQIHDPMIVDDNQGTRRFITRRTTLVAARGNIYDRNGVLLASGRPSYNIKIDWRALTADRTRTNTVVQELIYAAMDEGLSYTDTFPVTRGAPFEFLTNMSTVQENRLAAYLDFHNLDPDINVSDLLAWLRNHYRIDFTVGILEARLIIGVRYELEVRAIVGTINPYVFAYDVDTDFVSYLEERGLNGVYAESSFVREYHTTSASHILGYTGRMTAEEYEIYRERGYPMDAIVGKTGAEFAFEEYLHGSPGEKITRLTDNGTVVSEEILREPQPGQHVTLTIDINLQIAAEHALRTNIEAINAERLIERLQSDLDDEDEEDNQIQGGAVVVTDVNTGEVLAAVSYPSFDLNTLVENWAFLNTDPAFPMLNRTTQGRYAPGSTFKMVTALAALRHVRDVTQYLPINCTGVFDRYADVGEGFTAQCWFWGQHRVGHGNLYLEQAIERSCNFYFLQVSNWMPGGARGGAELLAETAMEFGLGIKTGLELPETAGTLALPEVREARGETGWYDADLLLAGFGQGDNRFTPVQLASYAATIGNGGTLYSLSILRQIRSSDFTETTHTHSPEILSQIEETDYLEIIQDSMVAVSRGRNGTARRVFGNYHVTVASKTGTVQIEGLAINNGLFVAYAPAEEPEIAISVIVEKGGSGAEIMAIARVVFEHYFASENAFRAVPYGDLIP